MRRRRRRQEPMRCSCEPGPSAHAQHAKPGNKTADHKNPKCLHGELKRTTEPQPKRKKARNLRINITQRIV